ncbi:dihydropteroate synthase [Reinekea sp.]|uniref:dihydropteroate synthase n=1 Tax=Reinekea sp. TaxID=1970455 RepID=UPI002A7EF690|nr:dihydropteroate synthase [Reinekea sp.]
MDTHYHFNGKSLSRSSAHVMGVLNVTPDSFSDGGRFVGLDRALYQAEAMIEAGAAIIDVGGESTRPGAQAVSEAEELARVVPVIEALSARFATLVSVDTSTPVVMLAAARHGAGLINDVRALQRPGALAAAAQTGLAICLMHMQGQPDKMQNQPRYDDVVAEVGAFFLHRLSACAEAGIAHDRVLLDPGFGFGKTLEHNLQLLNRLDQVSIHQMPLLVGTSRKSMIGAVLNKSVDERLYGSLATAAAALLKGAWIVRVHDVGPTVDVVRMLNAVRQERSD